eukprot:GHVL01017965.1.p1 GENE.GHVL01017965.1~~GHVL01017965.1.p1  ORF type:complete len:734 (-),score=50.82 GHVL01017965.1:627-2798(-)
MKFLSRSSSVHLSQRCLIRTYLRPARSIFLTMTFLASFAIFLLFVVDNPSSSMTAIATCILVLKSCTLFLFLLIKNEKLAVINIYVIQFISFGAHCIRLVIEDAIFDMDPYFLIAQVSYTVLWGIESVWFTLLAHLSVIIIVFRAMIIEEQVLLQKKIAFFIIYLFVAIMSSLLGYAIRHILLELHDGLLRLSFPRRFAGGSPPFGRLTFIQKNHDGEASNTNPLFETSDLDENILHSHIIYERPIVQEDVDWMAPPPISEFNSHSEIATPQTTAADSTFSEADGTQSMSETERGASETYIEETDEKINEYAAVVALSGLRKCCPSNNFNDRFEDRYLQCLYKCWLGVDTLVIFHCYSAWFLIFISLFVSAISFTVFGDVLGFDRIDNKNPLYVTALNLPSLDWPTLKGLFASIGSFCYPVICIYIIFSNSGSKTSFACRAIIILRFLLLTLNESAIILYSDYDCSHDTSTLRDNLHAGSWLFVIILVHSLVRLYWWEYAIVDVASIIMLFALGYEGSYYKLLPCHFLVSYWAICGFWFSNQLQRDLFLIRYMSYRTQNFKSYMSPILTHREDFITLDSQLPLNKKEYQRVIAPAKAVITNLAYDNKEVRSQIAKMNKLHTFNERMKFLICSRKCMVSNRRNSVFNVTMTDSDNSIDTYMSDSCRGSVSSSVPDESECSIASDSLQRAPSNMFIGQPHSLYVEPKRTDLVMRNKAFLHRMPHG